MKKVLSMLTIFVVAFTLSSTAQVKTNTGEGTAMKYELKDVLISSVKIKEGQNTVPVPDNGGTIKFTSRGKTITNVSYTDVAGKTTRLQPGTGAANGAPKPKCDCPLPDACFEGTGSIIMCMCKPCDLSNGNDGVSISLLLPAVQKVREASTRVN